MDDTVVLSIVGIEATKQMIARAALLSCNSTAAWWSE